MIPKDNPRTYQYLKEIALSIAQEINWLGSVGIRFYVVDVDIEAKAITATLHWCCHDPDPSLITLGKKKITDKLLADTRFNKVTWE